MDFPGGAVDENLPANAEDMGLILGLGRFPHASEQLRLCIAMTESADPRASKSQLLSPRAATTEVHVPRAHALQQEKPLQQEARAPQLESSPMLCN